MPSVFWKNFWKSRTAGLKTDWTVVWFSPIVIRHQAMTSMLLRYCFTVSYQIFQEPKYAVRLGKYFLWNRTFPWQLTGIIRHFLHRTTAKTEDSIFRTAIISYHFCNYVYVWTNPECTKKLLNFTGKPEHWNRNILLLFKIRSIFMRFWDFEKNAADRINPLQSVALRYILYCFPGTILQLHS